MVIMQRDIMTARVAQAARHWPARLLAVVATLATVNCACASGDLSDISDLGPPEPAFSTGIQSARVTQNGNGNTARVDQSGLNAAEVMQQGVANTALSAQTGTGNTAKVVQTGSANTAYVQQSGINLGVSVRQTGNGMSASVVQR